jgi:radical SAM protein with 4Fe4S-binding SPASM domain
MAVRDQHPIQSAWTRFITRNRHQQIASPGLYHYELLRPGERSRVHLRIDSDGSGLIMVNANRVMHLNASAALMSWLFLEKFERPQALRLIQKRYNVAAKQATEDYSNISATIAELVDPEGACPIHELNLDIIPPFSTKPSAPYRMDLAITYRCNNDCSHCYNARSRSYSELNTQAWLQILDKVWEQGIPHVVFTGGEPTLRQDLPELIRHAEKNGQITGINTNGRRLVDRGYLERLIDSGLDHVQITLESHSPAIHDDLVNSKSAFHQTIRGLENSLNSPLYVMTNTTLLKKNSQELEQTLIFLAKLGVPTVGLNALIYSGKGVTVGTGIAESDLPELLKIAQEITDANNQRLIWYTPTQYCLFDPMMLSLGIKGCTAARYNMCIESNGDVIPCQSYYHPVGNILKDEWNSIWNHSLCVKLRERSELPQKCFGCSLLPECGGGCPLQNQYLPDQRDLNE